MGSTVADELKNDLAAGRIVVIAGAGVSLAATGQAPTASWPGLLRAGIDRAMNFNQGLPEDWKDHLLEELSYAEGSTYLPNMLSVADKITDALGGRDGGEFRAWLRADIGELKVTDESLLLAIGDLGAPVATTNYDGLIEKVLQRNATTWLDPAACQSVIRRVSNNVLHLHGYWQDPASIILGSQSYGALTSNRATTHIEQVLASVHSLLLIGCGDGLSDPNFESLLRWLRRTFPEMEARHYRLCLEGEVPALNQLHKDDRITPLSYGSSHDKLLPFLRSLVPASKPRASAAAIAVPSNAVDAITARVRTETVLAQSIRDIEVRGLKSLLIPPVLLPVTPEQYMHSLDVDPSTPRPKRCQLAQDVRSFSRIMIVGAENSGLTTALHWMIIEAHEADNSLVPVWIDFRQLRKGQPPLQHQIRKELMASGVLARTNDPLPRLALALDNVSIKPEKALSDVIKQLRDENCGFAVVGCRQGVESALIKQLELAEISVTLRYIGPLSLRDAESMAQLVDPERANKLATKIMEITAREGLPRTPMTVGLLLNVLLHGEALLSTTSETSLLDAYVGLLLGRGDPHDDARFELDSIDRTDIVSTFAEHLIRSNSGSVTQAAALGCFERYFDAVGWSEDPVELLQDLRDRHLLTVRDGQVRFAQSSYLHLFSAKRAIESLDFRKILFESALEYSPVLRHYAGLTRSDADLLKTVEKLLVFIAGNEPHSGTNASGSGEGESFSATASIDELVEQVALPESQTDRSSTVTADRQSAEDEGYWLESLLTHDPGVEHDALPLDQTHNLPTFMPLMRALALTSSVLRDSELVKNIDLKKQVLHRTLSTWGKLVEILGEDPQYQELARETANKVATAAKPKISGDDPETLVDKVSAFSPFAFAFMGISNTLSSRKLLRVLKLCFDADEFISDANASVMGALLGFCLQYGGWSELFVKVKTVHPRSKGVRIALERFALMAYYYQTLGHEDAARIRAFLVDQLAQRLPPPANESIRNAQRARISQVLDKNRNLLVKRRAPSGTTAVGELLDAPETAE
jgi:hypothetical protein